MSRILAETTQETARDLLLQVRDLTIRARIGAHDRTIVSDVELSLAAGETIGIVGESGSGKSMTARALMGLLPHGVTATGIVDYGGRDLFKLPERTMRSLRGSEIGLVFQDPFTMLNPLRRCGRHIDELLRNQDGGRLRRAERHAEAVRRLAEVGIRDATVANRYPFELSGGMRQRVGIAAALARDPKILIADEPSTALDVTTQREILALLKSLQESRRMGLIMITHDLRVAFAMCDRIYVLYAGALLEVAPAAEIEAEPLHPYTLGLLLSEPPGDRRLLVLPSIEGTVPEPDDVEEQCPFAARCTWSSGVCVAGPTPLRPLAPARASACVRIDEIRSEMSERRRAASGAEHVQLPPASASALVQGADVRKVFVSGERRVTALDGVSFEIGENESVGLVGESGSGKTTLGRCIVGLETPTPACGVCNAEAGGALRRRTAAGGDRPGAGGEAEAARLRRAGLGARRLGTGSDPQSLRRAAERIRDELHVHHARSGCRASDRRARLRALQGRSRGGGPCGRCSQPARARLYEAAG